MNQAARLFAEGVIDGKQLAVMSQVSKAKLATVREQLAELGEASARRMEVNMPADVDCSDTSSADAWYALLLGLSLAVRRAYGGELLGPRREPGVRSCGDLLLPRLRWQGQHFRAAV